MALPCFFLVRCISRSIDHLPTHNSRISPADSIYRARLDTLIERQLRIDKFMTSVSIYDLTDDCPVYGYRDTLRLPPASCMKLITTAAARHFLGDDYRFADSLFVNGPMEGSTLKGDLIFKGDYDPMITSLDTLVTSIKRYGIERIEGNVWFCLPLREPIDYKPSWTPGDIRRNRLPIMLKGENFIRGDFMHLLRKAGVKVTGHDMFGEVPPGATCIASIGHTTREILYPTLSHSSNVMAEVLFTRVCEESGGEVGIYDFLENELGMKPNLDLEDGSGLSPYNLTTTQFLCDVLRHLWDEEGWIMEALPLAGSPTQRGTLMNRMSNNACKGRIYAKTGTLTSTGTSSLAGYCKGLFDHWYAFAIINHNTPVAEGRLFQDAVCLEMVRGK